MKILFAGFRDSSHSSAGGYDPIATYPGAKYYNGKYVPMGKKMDIPTRIWYRLSLKIFYIIVRLKRPRYDIVHCFYGDSAAYPFYKSKKHKIVITTHLDLADRKRAPKKFLKMLQKANGVIVLSSKQAEELREKHGINATFIPHGFNKPVFTEKLPECAKDLDSTETINIFVAGKQYRDAKLIIETVDYCRREGLPIRFHLMGQAKETADALRTYENAVVYPFVSDDEYFTVLSKCDYNFLPVTFASANNTLLEGQALGITGIFPKIDGITDYAAPTPGNIYYESPDDLKEIMKNLKKKSDGPDPQLLEHSKKFEWKNIHKLLAQYYSTLE